MRINRAFRSIPRSRGGGWHQRRQQFRGIGIQAAAERRQMIGCQRGDGHTGLHLRER